MSKTGRIFEGVLGVFLLCLGFFALWQDHLSLAWRLGGGAFFAILGVNSLLATWRGNESWLSRLGPIP